MLPVALEIFSADVLGGYRNMLKRLNKSKLYTIWSLTVMLVAFFAVDGIIAFINRSDEIVDFPLDLNDVLFLFFLVLMGKSILDIYHYLVERPASVFLLVQPSRHINVVLGKLLTTMVFNLALLAFGLGMLTAMTFVHPFLYFVIPPSIVVNLILLTLLASIVGFTYSILSGLKSWPRKLLGAALFSPVISSIYMVMNQLRIGGWELTNYLVIILLISLIGIPISSYFLLESWNNMTRSKATYHYIKRKTGKTFMASQIKKYFGPATLIVYDREVRTLLRRREGVGNAITLAGLLIFAIYFYNEFKNFLDFPGFFIQYIPILVVGLTLYLAIVSLGLIPALGAISRDGKSSWILKTAPVTENEIIHGKMLAVMLMLPFIVLFVAIPIPLISGLNPISILFTSIGAITMFFTATGIGIWHGTRSPNFDESSGNAPDVMTMYTFMLIVLFLSCFLLIPPLAIAFQDKFLGLMMLIISWDISLAILYFGTRGASKALRKLELSL